MPNPDGRRADDDPVEPLDPTSTPDDPDTVAAEQYAADFETEVISAPGAGTDAALPTVPPGPRRFTAPSGMDAGSTQVIKPPPDPATEIIDMGSAGLVDTGTPLPRIATPQEIPARGHGLKRSGRPRGRWGWLLAIVLVIAALAALAILGTMLLSRDKKAKASQEELVRATILDFDGAIQKGDLARLRSITCGTTADNYNKYDDRKWADTHARVAAAQQYPVVASVDQVVVNGEHAEANVTSFMAFDPATRSTRSFDLEFRDDQWKICQAPGS